MIPKIGQRWVFNIGFLPYFVVEITGHIKDLSAGGVVIFNIGDKYNNYTIGRKENDWTIHHKSNCWKLLKNQDKI